NLKHDAPDRLALVRHSVGYSAVSSHRTPGEGKSVVTQHGNPDEASRGAALLHLVPIHVRAIREAKHRLTSEPPEASRREGASPRSPSGRGPKARWRGAGGRGRAPVRPSAARAARWCGRRPGAASPRGRGPG